MLLLLLIWTQKGVRHDDDDDSTRVNVHLRLRLLVHGVWLLNIPAALIKSQLLRDTRDVVLL